MQPVLQHNRLARAMAVATCATACVVLAAPAWRNLMLARSCPDLFAVLVHALG